MANPFSRPRRMSTASSASSSDSSPERRHGEDDYDDDDDGDSLMLQSNDSQSSLGPEMPEADSSADAAARAAYEERCRVSPVARLPAELLISVFARLSASHDLMSCMLVSKEWARNSVGLLWHRPGLGKWASIQNVIRSVRKADKFFAYQDLVKRLNMSTLSRDVSNACLLGLQDCKRVERLTLTNCSKLTDTSLVPLLEGNRSLLAMDLTGLEHVTDRTMMALADHCLRLQGLNVTGCKKLTDEAVVAVAKNCRHVKRLKFNNCVQLTDKAILTVAAHSSHLLEIDLHALQNVESPSITALLVSCPQLREVRLAHCGHIKDQAFLDIPPTLNSVLPTTFDALRILDLTDCNELGDKGVERIIETCPRLRNLILAKCRMLTDRAVLAITKLGKNLHYIHLGHCQRITDLSVEALAKSCNRIRYIDLACCGNLTDNSITKLAGLPKLKRIGLVKCAGITDRSIYALAMGEMRGGKRIHGASVLERVHLSYCTLLTLDGIHTLLTSCPKLTHLSLTGVQAFLREDLLAFCREAPPEFNDHQRDVFCVFSGDGVHRLRDHLTNERLREMAEEERDADESIGGHSGEDEDEGTADESDGSNTPVLNLDVRGEHAASGTPVLQAPFSQAHPPPAQTASSSSRPAGSLPSGLLFAGGSGGAPAHPQVYWSQPSSFPNGASWQAGGSAILSSSAPSASTTPWSFPQSDRLWGGPPAVPGRTITPVRPGPIGGSRDTGRGHTGTRQTGGGVSLGGFGQSGHAGGAGAAQHVTGMMSAAMLDDVDEEDGDGDGDDGEGSESGMMD